MKKLIFSFICLLAVSTSQARTTTVDDDGPADFNNIQAAINDANNGDTAEASKSYFGKPVCETIVAGDINGDCEVNFLDFRLMTSHWLEDNTPPSPSLPSP